MKKFLVIATAVLVSAPLWAATGAVVLPLDVDLDRGVRVVGVFDGRTNLVTAVTGYELNIRDVISDEEKRLDYIGAMLAASNADMLFGRVTAPENPPMPRKKNLTGWSSTGSTFAHRWLENAGRCLDKVTVFSMVAIDEKPGPVNKIELKAQGVKDFHISTLVVSTTQPYFDYSGIDVVRVGSYEEFANYLYYSSSTC